MTPLETLLAPLDTTTFLQEYFHRRPHQWHTDSALCKRLQAFFAPDRLRSLLPMMSPLQVWFPSREGGLLTVHASPDQAWTLYRGGLTLYGTVDASQVPELADVYEMGHQIARDLDLSQNKFMLSFFASCKGAHTRAHFDNADGVTMQLHGVKRWAVGAPTVELPLKNHVLGDRPDPSMLLVTRGPVTSVMPPSTQEVTMRPGSMLYVPRAGWHTTWTDEDSISLDFNFSDNNRWKDHLAELVRHLMTPVTEARLPFTDGPDSPARFERLLDELRSRLARVQPAALRPGRGPRPAGAALQWNPLATFFILRQEERTARVTFQVFLRGDEAVEVTLRRAWLPLLDSLHGGSLLTEEQAVATPLPAREVANLLDLLWDEGVLQAAPSSSPR